MATQLERLAHEVIFPLIGDLRMSGAISETASNMLWAKVMEIVPDPEPEPEAEFDFEAFASADGPDGLID